MEINGRKIGPDHPPYLIAEISSNHQRDLDKAKTLIREAQRAGADAVKIQTFDADSLTIDCNRGDFVIQDPLWKGKTYYQLYTEIAMPREWTAELFAYADELGITLFSSPFDEAAVSLLATLDAPAYKIASFEANDWPLIRAAASTGKPLIISTGVSTAAELGAMLEEFVDLSGRIALLHCISAYPASYDMMNVRALQRLNAMVPIVGLSDHSLSNVAAITAIALGACIIEKHFTLSRADGGPDAAFSLEPHEFAELVETARQSWYALGDADVFDTERRVGSQHKRSLYVICDMLAGEPFTSENVRVIRPGFGLPPRELGHIIGLRAKQNITRGTALSWDLIAP